MEEQSSAFSRAVRQFVSQSTKRKVPGFIQHVLDGAENVTAEDVQAQIASLEKDSSQRISRKVMRPIFEAFLDYDEVLGVLCQADPMPSALAWGGMKAALECFRRYNNVFEKVEGQLKALTRQLKRLKEYEELFRQSEDMQELLVSSYLSIIKFWWRVESQCRTSGFVLAAKALTSFSTKKLDEILADIAENTNDIAKLVPIIQEQLRRGESRDVLRETQKMNIALNGILKVQHQEREARQRSEVQQWISGGMLLNERNDRLQHQRHQELLDGTGQWLFEDLHFNHWLEADSRANVIWLHGGPGVGKSVMCAHVVNELRSMRPDSAIVYQYFSFDESDRLLMTYRNMAMQLFHELYGPMEEISDPVHDITRGPASLPSMKGLIKTLITELAVTYVFLDGIDEELLEGDRWKTASDVVSFFVEIAKQENSPLKLWCSSQDRQSIRDLMSGSEEIQLGAATNSKDIEKLFTSALETRGFKDLKPAMQIAVLKDLRRQVNGNFLWASLMLDTINDATSYRDLIAVIAQGLPEDFEKYLERKIRSFRPGQYEFLSKVLSCLVFAKRPLFVTELCEAVAIYDHDADTDLNPACEVFESRLLDYCAPLIRVDEIDTAAPCKQLCTLSHGSVKTFLVKNPSVLCADETCAISPTHLAIVCMKYLRQPRYGQMLVRTGKTFSTVSDDDILDHPLLNYCAKYWYRHMDDHPYSTTICKEVESFVRSTNFITCIQIQSLLVGGQFNFYYRVGEEDRGPQLVRAFPAWFTGAHHCGPEINRQYQIAIGEWGYYLDELSGVRGKYPGQLERCLWPTLGKSNFLHKIPSDFKCFVLDSSDAKPCGESTALFSKVDRSGAEVSLYKMDTVDEGGDELHITREQWSLPRGHRPKLGSSCSLTAAPEETRCYCPATTHSKQATLAVAEDGRVLRVGSSVYLHGNSKNPRFRRLQWEHDPTSFIEDISCNNTYFAITSRRPSSEQIHKEEEARSTEDRLNVDRNETQARTGGNNQPQHNSDSDNDSDSSSNDSGDESDSESEVDGEATGTKTTEDTASVAGSTKSAKSTGSLSITSQIESPNGLDLDDFDASDNASLGSNSARESWSEGSTAPQSDEIEDEMIWNDFASDDDLEVEETGFISGSEESGPELDNLSDKASAKSAKSWLNGLAARSDTSSLSESTGSFVRSSSSSFRGDSTPDWISDSDDESGGEAGQDLDELLNLGLQGNRKGPACEIRIFRLHEDSDADPAPVFRFTFRSSGRLYASPPVFHPSRDLVVWPIGANEVFFANFTQKTYFTRTLRTDLRNSCQISVQCHFSPCGQYLHMASLDGFFAPNGDDNDDDEGEVVLALRLHISTYRLSKRKTARSPPKLVYRTAINLARYFSEGDKLNADNLPFTLTWTQQYVYVTESNKVLRVYRIPLYQDVEDQDKTEHAPKAIFTNSGDVFLPKSADMRKVYFFPESQSSSSKSKRQHKAKGGSNKEPYVATVLIDAQNASKPGQMSELCVERALPQGLHLTAAQLGKWETAEGRGGAGVKMLKKAETWKGGQLLAKFEKFDRSEDCDIVPYLQG